MFVVAILSDCPSPPSAARTGNAREREVAATVLAIRAICRRFRMTGFLNTIPQRQTSPSHLPTPEPDGEFSNQSVSIIGAENGRGNLSEGRRTTEGNLCKPLKTQ